MSNSLLLCKLAWCINETPKAYAGIRIVTQDVGQRVTFWETDVLGRVPCSFAFALPLCLLVTFGLKTVLKVSTSYGEAKK